MKKTEAQQTGLALFQQRRLEWVSAPALCAIRGSRIVAGEPVRLQALANAVLVDDQERITDQAVIIPADPRTWADLPVVADPEQSRDSWTWIQ